MLGSPEIARGIMNDFLEDDTLKLQKMVDISHGALDKILATGDIAEDHVPIIQKGLGIIK